MPDNIISPPDFQRIREKSREEQMAAGLEGEAEAQRKAGERYLITLEELVALETKYDLQTEQLRTKEAELSLWRSKSLEWKTTAKRRRTVNRRERRNYRILSLVTIFLALALLIAVGFIALQSGSVIQLIHVWIERN